MQDIPLLLDSSTSSFLTCSVQKNAALNRMIKGRSLGSFQNEMLFREIGEVWMRHELGNFLVSEGLPTPEIKIRSFLTPRHHGEDELRTCVTTRPASHGTPPAVWTGRRREACWLSHNLNTKRLPADRPQIPSPSQKTGDVS